MAMDPKIARKSPYAYEVGAGRTYFWCTCGFSNAQPFCDGAHKNTPFMPVKYVAEEAETVYFCGCKRTGGKPFCDGTHNGLDG
jgi:CDGSH-type Zn-finger protein